MGFTGQSPANHACINVLTCTHNALIMRTIEVMKLEVIDSTGVMKPEVTERRCDETGTDEQEQSNRTAKISGNEPQVAAGKQIRTAMTNCSCNL